MRYLGIDYGAKRVGIALSDDRGAIAFPRGVLKNDASLAERLAELARREGVETIVVGESKDKDGKDNPVMAGARALANELERALSVPVSFEPEYYSSVEARAANGGSFVDAQAAAVILNRYLERRANARGE